MLLDDFVGEVTIDPTDLRQFIKAWYKPEDTIALVAISPQKHGRKPLSQAIKVTDLMGLDAVDISELSVLSNGEKLNSYMTIFPVKKPEKIELHRRGSEDNVGDVYGTFIDLDVKKGAFESKEEILSFLTNDVPRPTIVVDNGESGGIHAYWRLPWDEVGDKDLLIRWWTFMEEKSSGRKIDKLVDLTRVSRMPSGIYWPKEGAGKVDTVKVVWSDGPHYSLQEFTDLTEEPFQRRNDRIQALWKRDTENKVSADTIARMALDEQNEELTGWRLYAAIATIEDTFNASVSWDDILEPAGWTFIREDNRGRREWARPGSDSKSATTDYEESPDMMSLLSSSEETGLADLKDANIALTKWRVAQRLMFDDSAEELTRYVLRTFVQV